MAQFQKGDERINRGGRPKNARNKINAKRDISEAIAKGKSLEDMVSWLSDRIDDAAKPDSKVSESQASKYVTELIKLKLALATIELKIMEEDNSKLGRPKNSEKPVPEVARPKFKLASNS